ncbi:hypothetical protein [Allosphingosinicella deserti]|uniref:Uncharacterized protein n=1 Tax=Allosphingosinicella deserti TaxID=2116704 RepID=A0A2P7QFT6_9SPHN|nr:hypothetical protein [Sphingomonas deserti]PSJ36804.1 hypothetical protein C7I55_24125 [Sphingomonas deserti]
MTYRDWRENTFVFKFKDAIGYQSFSPENRDLDRGTVEEGDPLAVVACRAAGEEVSTSFRVYSFVAAWDDQQILRIVATGVDHERATKP